MKINKIFLTILLLLTFLFLICSNSAVKFVNIDYKNQYLEPSKTYDLWAVIEPEENINNTVFTLKPYLYSKDYIEIIKGKDYEGNLFSSEKGVGHFIIKIKGNAPSKDYKLIVQCSYEKDGKTYTDNRVFTVPVRGIPSLTVENPPTIIEGVNTIYLTVSNKGTGEAQNVKIDFNNENENIYSLSSGYIKYIKPGENKLMKVKIVCNGEGTYKLSYKLTYNNPYDNLQLKSKTESIQSGNTISESYSYENKKTIEKTGNLIFKVIPKNNYEIKLLKYTYPVKQINNFTILLKNNNYKNTTYTIKLEKYYIGTNEKKIYLEKGEEKNISFKIKIDKKGVVSIPLIVKSNNLETVNNISINVIGKPQLILTGIDISGGSVKTITGDISNIGTSNANGVIVDFKKIKGVIPERPYENYFVGTLDSDDYGSFELHCKLDKNINKIPIIISYRDENNNLINEEKYITLNLEPYNNENINDNKNINDNSNFLIYSVIIVISILFVIFVILLGVYIYLKNKKQKSKTNEEEV